MSKPTCYIAGPMRGYVNLNYDAFDHAELLGGSIGYRIISPANLDRAVGIDGSSESEAMACQKEFVLRDIAAILSCSHIAMLPGHTKSIGASAELAVARWLGLTILTATTFLPLEPHHV